MIDVLIIGQGIAGTLLSYNFLKAGKSVIVIDEAKNHSASKVASGVINPVTGRRVVRTWMIETLMPYAFQVYQELENELNISIISQKNILDFHATPQMMLAFKERIPIEKEYLVEPNYPILNEHFNYVFGVGEINPCYLIDVNNLLETWRKKLVSSNNLLEEYFDIKHLQSTDEFISYKNITAKSIIFCDGSVGSNNPYFSLLPYAKNKGEAIIADIPNLPPTNIYKQGISLVPWQNNLWWIGSTYEWDFTHLNPTEAFKNKVEQQLQHWLKLPYTIVDHFASERPANLERRPFVGFHPLYKNIGLFNGLGTKGCSLAPYFANQLVEHVTHKKDILPIANVQRFTKILSR